MLKTLKNLDLRNRILLIVLGAALVVCLAMIAVSPARSALVFQSNDYEAEIKQTHIGVTLTENGNDVDPKAQGMGKLLDMDNGWQLYNVASKQVEESMRPGETYRELLSVQNVSSDMDEYVRLTVRKYWAKTDKDTNNQVKDAERDPALIELIFDKESAEHWVRAENECTEEREVFYYKHVLGAGEKAVEPAITGIRVSNDIKNTKESYRDNCLLALFAQVDSVQVNNAADAAKSAWGVDIADLGLDWSGNETNGPEQAEE